jgi:protein kinase-like protein
VQPPLGSTPPPYRPPSSRGPASDFPPGTPQPGSGPDLQRSATLRLRPGLQARYAVQAELGRGGMGVVYLAHDRERGVEVALKVLLSADLSEVQRTRFLREGQVTRELEHPGIVRLLDHGEVEGQPYLAYELIVGARPLDEVAAERRFFDRLLLVRDAARALGYAHQRGVLHRDVKPDNLLVGGDGRLRVTDFGLAALEGGERMTRTGALIGTPFYMSPEQFAGAKQAEVDARADVWALGVCLYQVAAGELPFQGESLVEIGGAIARGTHVPPSQVAPDSPPALDALVAQALAPDPEQRFSDGEALAQALDQFLDGQDPARRSKGKGGLILTALGLTALLALVAAGAALALESGAPTPTPSATPAPTTTPTPSPREDLAGARSAARAGRLDEAIERASAFDSLPGRVLHVELLLESDQIAAAASALQGVAEPERSRLEALRLLLAARDPQEALRALGAPESPEATLVRDVASFLADPKAQPKLTRAWFARRIVIDLARAEVQRLRTDARDDPSSTYVTQVKGSYQEVLQRARRKILEQANRKDLWEGHLLERALRAEIQASLHSIFMIHFVIWSNAGLLRAEWEQDIQEAIDLQPTGPCARRLLRLQRGMRLGIVGRGKERKVRVALAGTPPHDPRRALFGVPPADRWFHLLISFVAHPRPDRRALAHEVLRARPPQADMSGRLRRELCLQLCRTERGLAYQAFLAGDAARGEAAAGRAIDAAKKMLEPIKSWRKRSGDNLMKRDCEEAGLAYLVAGKFSEARKNLDRCGERLKQVYRGEVLMAQGKLQEAAKLLLAMTKDGKERPPELEFQLTHLTLLLGRPDQARTFLERLTPGVVSERMPWRGTETTRALVEGRGWWPGQKR